MDAQISFEEDSADEVTGLVFHRGGHDVPGKKEYEGRLPRGKILD